MTDRPPVRHALRQPPVTARELLRTTGVLVVLSGPGLLVSAVVLVLVLRAYPGVMLIGADR